MPIGSPNIRSSRTQAEQYTCWRKATKCCLFVPRSSLLSLIQLSLRNQPPVQSRSSFPLLSAGTNRGPWSLFILSVKQLQISHFSMSSVLHILCFSTFTSLVRMNLYQWKTHQEKDGKSIKTTVTPDTGKLVVFISLAN